MNGYFLIEIAFELYWAFQFQFSKFSKFMVQKMQTQISQPIVAHTTHFVDLLK